LIERCRCGAELLPELHFCAGCGALREVRPPIVTAARPTGPLAYGPEPPRAVSAAPVAGASGPATGHADAAAMATYASAPARSSTPWIVASATIVVVTVLAALAVLALRPAVIFGGPVVQPAPVAPAATPSTVPAPVSRPRSTAPATSYPSTSASELLTAQVDRDRPAVESVTGRWVPQLSSKRPGTVAAGVSYDADTILIHYQGLAAQYPGTALLWSGDWPVFNGRDYWVVIVAQSFSTAAEANAWCDAQGFAAGDCLAKKLSHSGGPQGTTVPRS
jgi:hypothetical protein